jgi:hypothetical protein
LLLFLLILCPAFLTALDKTGLDFATFIETETNNSPYSGENLILVPGLIMGIKGLETPVYGRFSFENRMKAENSADDYQGNELRHIYVVGGRIGESGGHTFNPELEIRVKNYVGYSFDDKSNIENRFHLRFLFPVGRGWSILLNTMPTLLLASSTSSREEGATGNTTYFDFYNESLLGTVWKINQKNSLTAAFYNELRDYQDYEWSDGSVNDGGIRLMNEFQFRLSWTGSFSNGVVLVPFVRIGIVRNEYYVDAGGVERTEDYRRDRYGVLIRNTSSDLTPFLEAYYQYQEENGATPQHMMFWKVGMNYSI